MEIQVRDAGPRDYDDLNLLFDQVDALHRDHLPEIFQAPAGPPRARQYLLDLMVDPNYGLFIARVEEQPAGAIVVSVRDTPPIPLLVPRRFAIIQDLVVWRGFRRMGVGRALMATAHRWAADRGAESIELTVYEFNQDAVDFYRELGYGTLSRTMRHDL